MATKEEVAKVIEEQIAPRLAADGGGIELLEVSEDGVVKVKLQGACAGCPGARMTLQHGVEKVLKENLPDVTQVVAE